MIGFSRSVRSGLWLTILFLALSHVAAAQEPGKTSEAGSSDSSSASKTKSKFEQLTDGMKKQDGMWTVYTKDQKLLVDLKSNDLDKEYIVLTSIARGISRGMVLGGMSWNFGDDVIWSFRKVGENIHVLRRNVRFRAKPKSPEADAVKLAYSDSVLYALPILTQTPGGQLVDMTRIFMSDDPEIGRHIGSGFRFVSDRSTFAAVKEFPSNLELQVAAVYSGTSTLTSLNTVADPRGVQIHVHYSISELPKTGANGYKPRVADDRIGYFLTVLKDFSDKADDEHFVRYINRWHLTKKDPEISVSPPAEPIRFYIERTVPVWLRPTVRAGILEWNKAFDALGFAGAIEVLQQEDDADWDPEDIRYNTFRWMTADAGFAMGPSRVDPRTGQILDADIIFDASFLDYWKQDYETLSEAQVARLRPNWTPSNHHGEPHAPHASGHRCLYCTGMQHQMGFAAAVLTGRGVAAEGKLPEEFIHQGLKEVVMHEVGHTLGLRHNFKASSWKTLNELVTAKVSEPTVASVMDYAPANISAPGEKQGPYFSQTIGPYDYWAIQYGYKVTSGDENAELKNIASRSAESGHDYATDEDTDSLDSDPLSNRYDLGQDPIVFVRRQMKIADELMPKVVERSVEDGQGYQRARQAFGILLSEYWRSALFASRFPGGVYVHRDHKGDADARPPFRIVPADKQREAMKLLMETTFASPQIDGGVLNYLAASRWDHWGMSEPSRLDYPIHATIARLQQEVVSELLDETTLSRLQDAEVKVADGEDLYTLAEHLNTIIKGAFSEWAPEELKGAYTNRDPCISSFRRSLQREVLKQISRLVTSGSNRRFGGGTPEDARTLSRLHLSKLSRRAKELLEAPELELDDYSRAHLLDSQARIDQVLEATLTLSDVD